MAYITWAEVAKAVDGEKRLKEQVLQGHVETVDSHPEFTRIQVIAEQKADAALRKAGYVTPLAAVTDEVFRNSVIGLWVGEATRSLDNRAAWMEKMEAAALKYFQQVANGDVDVIGAEYEASADVSLQMLSSVSNDLPIFDIADENAKIHDVFADLGSPSGWRRMWP